MSNNSFFSREMHFETVNPVLGLATNLSTSEGNADPATVRIWSEKDDGNDGQEDNGGSDDKEIEATSVASSIIGSIIGVVAVSVVIAMFYLFYYKRGPLFRLSRRKNNVRVSTVYLPDRDQENPRTPARFSTRTAPTKEEQNNNEPDDREDFDVTNETRRASDASAFTFDGMDFKTNVYTEFKKNKGPRDDGDRTPPRNPPRNEDGDRTPPRNWEKEEEETRRKEEETRWEKEEDETRWEKEEEEETRWEKEEEEEDRKATFQPKSKSYRRKREPTTSEPEAEPPSTEYSFPFGSERWRQYQMPKMPTAPKIPAKPVYTDITVRESLEFLAPKPNTTVEKITTIIAKWMHNNVGQDFESRKKAIRHLSLMWHPDKNADCLELAHEVFQLIQAKKNWFLKPDEK